MKNQIKKAVSRGLSILLVSTVFFSCKKDPNPITPNVPEPEFINYTGILIDSFTNEPMKNIPIRLVISYTPFTGGSLWDILTGNSTSGSPVYTVLDTFFTNDSGKFTIRLNRQQRSDLWNKVLEFKCPDQFIPIEIRGSSFSKLKDYAPLYCNSWSILKVDFFTFKRNSCDYYHLYLEQYPDTTSSFMLIDWSYGSGGVYPNDKFQKIMPGNYRLKARYSCGSFTKELRVPFIAKPRDTLVLSTVL